MRQGACNDSIAKQYRGAVGKSKCSILRQDGPTLMITPFARDLEATVFELRARRHDPNLVHPPTAANGLKKSFRVSWAEVLKAYPICCVDAARRHNAMLSCCNAAGYPKETLPFAALLAAQRQAVIQRAQLPNRKCLFKFGSMIRCRCFRRQEVAEMASIRVRALHGALRVKPLTTTHADTGLHV